MTSTTKFRVAICGGGIGGLALALGLAEYDDIRIDIYEAASKFKEIGAGIGIWGRGISALRKWNLEQKAREIATAAPGQNEGVKFDLRRADKSPGELMGHLAMSTNLGFHRSQLIDFFADELIQSKRANTHFGKRCVSFEQAESKGSDSISKEPVTLHFLDGTSATCDILVGCDGIKSAVRGELLYGSTSASTEDPNMTSEQRRFIDTRFSGTVAYRALVDPEHLRAIHPEHGAISGRKMYCGKRRHLVTYPVAQGRFLNFIAYSSDPRKQEEWQKHSWEVEANHDELVEHYTGFEPEVQMLLKCVDKTSRWAMYDLEPLKSWSKGRVTLLGDAAHATTPFVGAGGGQVLEDAYLLSRLLGSSLATSDTLPFVLSAYERVRMPRANEVIRSSREARRCFEFLEEYDDSSNERVVESLARVTDWLFEGRGEIDDDVQEAERLLKEMIGKA